MVPMTRSLPLSCLPGWFPGASWLLVAAAVLGAPCPVEASLLSACLRVAFPVSLSTLLFDGHLSLGPKPTLIQDDLVSRSSPFTLCADTGIANKVSFWSFRKACLEGTLLAHSGGEEDDGRFYTTRSCPPGREPCVQRPKQKP